MIVTLSTPEPLRFMIFGPSNHISSTTECSLLVPLLGTILSVCLFILWFCITGSSGTSGTSGMSGVTTLVPCTRLHTQQYRHCHPPWEVSAQVLVLLVLVLHLLAHLDSCLLHVQLVWLQRGLRVLVRFPHHPFWSLFWASLILYSNHTVPDNS